MFERRLRVRLHHTDAAGILFFSRQLELIHDVYADWLIAINWNLRKVLEEDEFRFPIVHVDSDYHEALKLDDELIIQMTTDFIKDSSFCLKFDIYNYDGSKLVGRVKTIQACITSTTPPKKLSIPPFLRDILLNV